MKTIDTEEFKKISLDVLCAVHEFCQEHNIKYSLACGTLIGAIRHKGYIPWDDDIDIYMIREDYNRFMKLFPELYQEKYALSSFERSTPYWNYPFAKVHDVRTILVEEKKYPIPNMGVGIDVFPIDNAPDKEKEWIKYEKIRKFLRNIYTIKELKWRKERALSKNLFVMLCTIFLLPVSYIRLARILDKYSQKFNNSETNYYAENCMGRPNNRFLKTDFQSCMEMPFENRMLMVMKGYDDYLRKFYGDYMKLPPIEQQRSHYRNTVYWK